MLVFNTFSLNTPWTGWSLGGEALATSSGKAQADSCDEGPTSDDPLFKNMIGTMYLVADDSLELSG